MKRPTWVTVVGVCGIVLGCFGLLGSVQAMMMPTVMEFQKEIFAGLQEEMGRQQEGGEKVFEALNKMWDVPEWFNTWSVAAGVIGLFVSGFYIIASIFLLQIKRSSIQLFYTALSICICFALVKGIVAVSAMTIMGMSMMVWSVLGLIINIILLAVVATSDKKVFSGPEQQ